MKTILILTTLLTLTFIACGGDDETPNNVVGPTSPPAHTVHHTDAQNQKIEDIEHTVGNLMKEWQQIKTDLDNGIQPDLDSLRESVDGLLEDLGEIQQGLEKLTTLINAKPTTTPVPSGDPARQIGGTGQHGQISFQSDGQIYLIDSDGANLTNLTNHIHGGTHPAWSPDGNTLAFISHRGQGADGIWTMNADGSNQQLFFPALVRDNPIAWDPRGGSIVFEGHDGIYLGGNIKPTFIVDGIHPAWSLNGEIAFISDDNNHGWTGVSILDVHVREPVRITPLDSWAEYPAWSPDGSHIAYTGMAGDGGDDNREIYVMTADGPNPINLTRHPGRDEAPTWSPDGRRIAFMSNRPPGFNWEIYIMNADGTQLRNLTNSPNTHDRYPAWRP